MRTLAVLETTTSVGSLAELPFVTAGVTVTSQDTRTAEVLDVIAEIDEVLLENALARAVIGCEPVAPRSSTDRGSSRRSPCLRSHRVT